MSARYSEEAVHRPNHYLLPSGVEVKDVSMWLTSMGGQAVQYIVRACRIDGVAKENPLEDLNKAIAVLEFERARLEMLASSPAGPPSAS